MSVDRYLVVGNPIAHSKSPVIHRAFAEQTGQTIEYTSRLIELEHFEASIRSIQAKGILGVNVTVPFKEEACRIADELGDRAQHAGAANTLVFKADKTIYADNTDGVGLVRDIIINNRQKIKGKRILILGAGGAVRGILKPLIDEKPESLTIANRSIDKAEGLKQRFSKLFEVTVKNIKALEGDAYDLIINGTSLGLQGKVVPLPDNMLSDNAVAYDMMYGDGSLPFQHWASSQGANLALDGSGMLVEQAAESFFIWRGIRPDTKPVINMLRGDRGG